LPEPAPASVSLVGRIYRNLGLLLGGKASAGLLSLAYIAIAARALGAEGYGVLVLVHAYVIAVGGIVNFPGWHAVVRFGAQALDDGDEARLVRLLRRVALVEILGGLAALATALLLAPVVGPRLGWSPQAQAMASLYCLAVFASVHSTPAGLLQLMGRFDLLALHTAVAPAIRLVGALVAVALGAGLRGFLIAWLVAALAEFAVMWIMGYVVARRRLGVVARRGRLFPAAGENPGLWRFMWAANSDVTLADLAGRLAPLTVGWMLGPAAAGLYGVAQRITTVIAQPAQIFGHAAYAELARHVAAGHPPQILRAALVRATRIGVLAALPVVLVLLVFGRPIAVAVGGKGFAEAATVLPFLVLARVILLPAAGLSSALIALGRPGRSVTANVVSSLGLYPLLPLLLWRFSLAGAGLHALLQATAAVALLIVYFREAARPAVA
jgi:O-antigen/teichoic acid export membrane protein